MPATATQQTITYTYQDGLYINLTSRCSVVCKYCIKYQWGWRYRGYQLRLTTEPSAAEILEAVEAAWDPTKYREIIFCGYGEPFMRLDTLKEVAAALQEGGRRVRVNTTGQGNLIHGRNVVPELQGLLDCVSVSFNAESPEAYAKHHIPHYGEQTFPAMVEFVRECVKYLPEVFVTCVDLPGVNVEGCRRLAESLGATFRFRPYLDAYEAQ